MLDIIQFIKQIFALWIFFLLMVAGVVIDLFGNTDHTRTSRVFLCIEGEFLALMELSLTLDHSSLIHVTFCCNDMTASFLPRGLCT